VPEKPNVFKGPKIRIDRESKVRTSPFLEVEPEPTSARRPVLDPEKQRMLDSELYYAISDYDVPRIKTLVMGGADVNTRCKIIPPLHFASMRGYDDVVSILLDHGADAKATYGGLITALHVVSANGRAYETVFPRFLDWALGVKKKSKREEAESRTRIVRLLLAHGADPNARDGGGNAPLHWAVCYASPDLVDVLLASRADPNLRNRFGETPLHHAHLFIAPFVGSKIVTRLLMHRADPKIRDLKGRIPEHCTDLSQYGVTRLSEYHYGVSRVLSSDRKK